ncbi:hypothetical protein LXL04_017254 [Taraxacum kok-saghyz]
MGSETDICGMRKSSAEDLKFKPSEIHFIPTFILSFFANHHHQQQSPQLAANTTTTMGYHHHQCHRLSAITATTTTRESRSFENSYIPENPRTPKPEEIFVNVYNLYGFTLSMYLRKKHALYPFDGVQRYLQLYKKRSNTNTLQNRTLHKDSLQKQSINRMPE